MIQKPNIKFSVRDTISLKDTSPNSPFLKLKISPENWTLCRVKTWHYSRNPLICQTTCKTRENSNFLKKGKMVILIKIRNISRSRMTKQTSSLESSREI